MLFLKLLLSSSLSIRYALASPSEPQLPKVDLGYEIHQAIGSNPAYYNFSNIRYAQPPVGDLRFAAPVPPTGRSKSVNQGARGTICPQANPLWGLIAQAFTLAYATGKPFNYNEYFAEYKAVLASLPELAASSKPDPRTTEDCLFLDVIVPKMVFDKKTNGKGAAVLVWIYGGGYTAGYKNSVSPGGLMQRSQVSGSPGIIYVSMNYRLGAMGWSSGPTFQASGGIANAGLYDQRLALEWVQKYIHLFGGDPQRVTVFGESAGGGSLMHQITAFGGLKPVSFSQALPQSPGWLPTLSQSGQETVFNNFLALLNVSSLAEARRLPSSAIITANSLQVATTPVYGSFVYGPTVDGVIAPALPGQLLAEGRFAKNIRVMVGHNFDEGPAFSNPSVTNKSDVVEYITTSYPGIPQSSLDYIQNMLYPLTFDGSQPYRSQLEREILIVSESIFTCNTNYLARAFGNKTYNYEFAVPPAFHGFDVNYTYAPPDPASNPAILAPQIAIALQEYITSFAETGIPVAKSAPPIPQYGPNAQLLVLNVTGITKRTDPTANRRCLWWQKGLLN